MARQRIFIGAVCGPAADGVDICAVGIGGGLLRGKAEQLAWAHAPLADDLACALRELMAADAIDPRSLAGADAELSAAMTDATAEFLRDQAIAAEAVAAVGLAGPILAGECGHDGEPGGVLTIGRGEPLARRAGIAVVDGFAASDAAMGGCGSGVTLWPTWKLLADRRLSRVLVHLGGLATLTFLGGGCDARDVRIASPGPCGLVLDELARRLFSEPFDRDGAIAARGKVSPALLAELDALAGRTLPAPQTAPAARPWGPTFIDRLLMAARKHRCGNDAIMATACEWVARNIARAVEKWTEVPHEVILCGGGALNIHLAGRIRSLLSPSSTYGAGRYGFDARALAPAMHAMLAAARLDGIAAHCPEASGAGRPGPLGTLHKPDRA
jgi:anhydro-N-acetylmuramic acid kinase